MTIGRFFSSFTSIILTRPFMSCEYMSDIGSYLSETILNTRPNKFSPENACCSMQSS